MGCLIHRWDGCTCAKCGKTRDTGHRFAWKSTEGGCWEICTVCGVLGQSGPHQWERIPGTCEARCPRCGITGELHSFVDVEGRPCTKRCTTCGEVRTTHTWRMCICTVCGELKENNPSWNHRWVKSYKNYEDGTYAVVETCNLCGKQRESQRKTPSGRSLDEVFQNLDEGICS